MLLCLACADVSWATIVPTGPYTVLGRQTGASHVVLNHPSTPKLLSRQHCRLQLRPDGLLEVTDLNSVNGTFIAEAVPDDAIGQHQVQRLQPHIPQVLKPGSTLMLGGEDAVMGVHGQVVSNPFVFLVCGGAVAGSAGSEDAAAAAAAAAACQPPQGQGKPKQVAGASAGPGAASTSLEQQWAECQQQQHPQRGSTSQPKQQQQQQQPSLTDQQVLQHQQQREPPNSPGVRAVSALLPLAQQQYNQSNSMAQMHDRSAQEYAKPALQQQHRRQHTDLVPCPPRQQVQPCVVGVLEPRAKRHCARASASQPHLEQGNGQQQLAPPGGAHSPPAQFTSQQPAAATHADSDGSPTGSLQSFQQASHESDRAGGAAARGTDRPAGSEVAPPSVALAATAAEACSSEEQLHSPGVSTAAGGGACEPAAGTAAGTCTAPLHAAAAEVAAAGAVDSSSRRDVRKVSASHLDCTICRELLVATHTLACGHMFCGPCLAQWLEVQAHPSCPSCRTAVESAPVRVYLFDKIVAEAALTSGSEPQEMAARSEMWNAIKEDTTAQWHSKFGSSNTSKHVQDAAAGAQLGPHRGASSRRAVRQRQQGDEEPPEALHLRRGDMHLLTGLRHPPGVAAAATAATTAAAVPGNSGIGAGRSNTSTAPRPRHKQQGSRRGGHLAQQRHSSTSAQGAQKQQRSAVAASRQPNQLRGVGSSAAQQRNGTAIHGMNLRPPSTAVVGDPARPLRQTSIAAFIQ